MKTCLFKYTEKKLPPKNENFQIKKNSQILHISTRYLFICLFIYWFNFIISNWNLYFTLRKDACSNILKILSPKNEHFQIKSADSFHISAQNLDCVYSLEPPRNVYLCQPQFYYIKVGLRGSKLYRYVFVMKKNVLLTFNKSASEGDSVRKVNKMSQKLPPLPCTIYVES